MESTSTPSSPNLGPGTRTRSPNAARLARKRATDRRSQRNHRERQRAYVRSLEETIASLKDASNADQRVASLSAENETLRTRCQALAKQLQRIRTISSESTAVSDVATHVSSPHDIGTSVTGDSAGRSGIEDPSFIDQHLEPVVQTDENSFFAIADEAIVRDEVLTADDMPTEDYPGLSSDLQTLDKDPILSLVAFENPSMDLLLEDTMPSPSTPPLPEYARPQGSADRLLHAMLEEAVAEHHMGRFDTSKPSLNRLLVHGPVDLLSFRLFHYINQYGAMPMHWMLAIFWVQYLYLRWHVLRTHEAYTLIPDFMRPTSLECAIPHRISISMIVWPDIRQSLIRDALSVNPEDVGVELLKSLPASWTSSSMTGDMIASMDVYTMIEKQASQQEFWKVGPNFLHAYPQYKNCTIGVA